MKKKSDKRQPCVKRNSSKKDKIPGPKENNYSGSVEALLFLISKFMQNFRKICSAVPEKNCDVHTHPPTYPRGALFDSASELGFEAQ